MQLIAAGRTDIGKLRKINQDCCLVDAQLGLFVVADGMGGHAAGEVASEMAVDVVRDRLAPLLAEKRPSDELRTVLRDTLFEANHSLIRAAANNPAWRGMGTTLTVLLLQDGQGLLGHVGDTRLYRRRDGRLEQLSEDHSLVADQLRRGSLSPEAAAVSTLSNILLQALGASAELDPCEKQFSLRAGDCFLLCSDGLTGMLDDEQLAALLNLNLPPEQGCRELIDQANAAGGQDNLTAVLVEIVSC